MRKEGKPFLCFKSQPIAQGSLNSKKINLYFFISVLDVSYQSPYMRLPHVYSRYKWYKNGQGQNITHKHTKISSRAGIIPKWILCASRMSCSSYYCLITQPTHMSQQFASPRNIFAYDGKVPTQLCNTAKKFKGKKKTTNVVFLLNVTNCMTRILDIQSNTIACYFFQAASCQCVHINNLHTLVRKLSPHFFFTIGSNSKGVMQKLLC